MFLTRALAALVVIALSMASDAAAAEPEAPDLEPALPAPLAARSLLLGGDREAGLLAVVGERGHVLVSADAGASWDQARVPTRATLTAIDLLPDGRGFAVGHEATVLRTGDGGRTWALVRAAPAERRPLLGVAFVTREHGFAVGAYGLMLETRDGGDTWRARAVEADDRHLNHIAATPAGRLFVAGESGRLYRSDDRGATWRRLSAPYAGSFFGTLALDETRVYAYGLRGHVFRSDDAGGSWRRIHTGVESLVSGGIERGDGGLLLTGTGGAILLGETSADRLVVHRRPDRLGVSGALPAGAGAVVLFGEFGVERMVVDTIVQRR